jgi:SAM-dependent methyltransferase
VTTSFGDYSSYYNLLYSDKEYDVEVSYIQSLLKKHAVGPIASLLEMGCGTGIHAGHLAASGIEVLGFDLSQKMLAYASEHAHRNGMHEPMLTFALGDARTFRAGKCFDVVTSLFHVFSYQASDADQRAMLQTAGAHLVPGGLFIFDFWYGPAVLWQRPATRVKYLEDSSLRVTRVAEPVIRDRDNIVDVNYRVFVTDCESERINEISEVHTMRFVFLPEISKLLAENGFELIEAEEWISGRAPSTDTWGVCVIARKC